MNVGGFVSKKSLKEMTEQFKERPSWWLVDGKLAHCCSWEIEIIKEINKNKFKKE